MAFGPWCDSLQLSAYCERCEQTSFPALKTGAHGTAFLKLSKEWKIRFLHSDRSPNPLKASTKLNRHLEEIRRRGWCDCDHALFKMADSIDVA
jgi:DNA-binding IclR family transcriptional regulator